MYVVDILLSKTDLAKPEGLVFQKEKSALNVF